MWQGDASLSDRLQTLHCKLQQTLPFLSLQEAPPQRWVLTMTPRYKDLHFLPPQASIISVSSGALAQTKTPHPGYSSIPIIVA